MPAPPFIELDKITKKFGNYEVLKDISLKIPYGEITGVIGQSGSGKTTILNLIIGFIKPSKGKILFQSRDIFKDMNHVNKLFGFGSQGFSFYEELTVEENLKYFAKLYGINNKTIKKRIDEVLKLVDLPHAKKVLGGKLSAGMKRRLDIACALMHDPKVLILDEPTQDLDPILRKELAKVLQKIKRDGTTIILTSHLLGEVENMCDNVAILNEGKIVKFNKPKQLKKIYKKDSLEDVFTAIIEQTRKIQTKKQIIQKEIEEAGVKKEAEKSKKEELSLKEKLVSIFKKKEIETKKIKKRKKKIKEEKVEEIKEEDNKKEENE